MHSVKYDSFTGKAMVSISNEDYERIVKPELTLRDLLTRILGSNKKKK
jgi:hypothetical protein